MNSAKELINWFWRDAKFAPRWSNRPQEVNGPCQCATEKLCGSSSDPNQMRAFMMVGVLVDQMMWTHFRDLYPDFYESFRYPKLYSHPTAGMAGPNWMAYTSHGYDKKVKWSVVSEVCHLLLNDLYDWFKGKGLLDEMINFQKILKVEVNIAFETVNRDKLMPVIESIERRRS